MKTFRKNLVAQRAIVAIMKTVQDLNPYISYTSYMVKVNNDNYTNLKLIYSDGFLHYRNDHLFNHSLLLSHNSEERIKHIKDTITILLQEINTRIEEDKEEDKEEDGVEDGEEEKLEEEQT